MMAWGGKHSRMTMKQRSHFFRSANRSLPPREKPTGVPPSVTRQLQEQTLSGNQEPYMRLQQLLSLRELNKGG